jgi:hypothetical protein
MTSFQKAILTIIIVIGISELGPKIINRFFGNNKVKVGEIWSCRLPVTVFRNNFDTGEVMQISLRKVIKVDGDEITYVIANDTTKYVMNVDEFTFNGKGMTTQKVE